MVKLCQLQKEIMKWTEGTGPDNFLSHLGNFLYNFSHIYIKIVWMIRKSSKRYMRIKVGWSLITLLNNLNNLGGPMNQHNNFSCFRQQFDHLASFNVKSSLAFDFLELLQSLNYMQLEFAENKDACILFLLFTSSSI
jgi:hypothetical protein